MAKTTIIFWRDIPSQVIVKQGRNSAKSQLSKRFMEAIDKAAMRAGRQGSSEYLEDWRRVIDTRQGDPKTIANNIAEELENEYNDEILKGIVKNKGIKSTKTKN